MSVEELKRQKALEDGVKIMEELCRLVKTYATCTCEAYYHHTCWPCAVRAEAYGWVSRNRKR